MTTPPAPDPSPGRRAVIPPDAGIPRPEYPRPHRVRERWQNLNGTWEFAFDDGDRGLHEGWHTGRPLPQRIVVPFSFEAPRSGIGDTAVHSVVWYRREVDIADDLLGDRLMLHIGASDFHTRIWVNGRAVGAHRGGYAPIACEIQAAARPGRNEIVIRVEDRPVWTQPRGKQTTAEHAFWIDYDRTTGIWQTVWLEPLPAVSVEDVWCHFHLDGDRLEVHVATNRPFGGEAEAVVSLDGTVVASGRAFLQDRLEARIELRIPEPRLWSVDSPTLYEVRVSLHDAGRCIDAVDTYAGLREFTRRGHSVLLNGEPFFFRGVLDQGYFPDGWYTAASDADLRRDIELMQAAGFNGARKHQKAEDPRWLMWADRLGFVVWGEMGNGRDFTDAHVEAFTGEWLEIVRRDRMHPCIMAWVPLNESWGVDQVGHSAAQREWVRTLYHLTHALDGTRPVVANDGWQYFVGDIWGLHSYVAEGAPLERHLRTVLEAPETELIPEHPAALPGADVSGIPVMLTEFGGIALYDPRAQRAGESDWGYASAADPEALAERLRSLVRAVSAVTEVSGFVWTQFTDVQQEINGVFFFDRTPKLPLEALRGIFGPGGAGKTPGD